MNIHRLELLADLLEKLPPERFDYSLWVGLDWKGAPDLSCGTTGCALGWATTIPELAALGLRLERANGRYSHVTCDGVVSDPFRDDSYQAATIVFDITMTEAVYLFTPDDDCGHGLGAYASPLEVAELIRAFIAAGGIPS